MAKTGCRFPDPYKRLKRDDRGAAKAPCRGEVCSPDEAKRNPGAPYPHCAALHAGYDSSGMIDVGQIRQRTRRRNHFSL
jgi:hypothetical protein